MDSGWAATSPYDLICVDSYHNGIPQGRLHSLPDQASRFGSLSQLLICLEDRLRRHPQSASLPHAEFLLTGGSPPEPKTGKLATFRLRVLFREHSSWQGTIQWLEGAREANFRSVLELVFLIDSSLNASAGKISSQSFQM